MKNQCDRHGCSELLCGCPVEALDRRDTKRQWKSKRAFFRKALVVLLKNSIAENLKINTEIKNDTVAGGQQIYALKSADEISLTDEGLLNAAVEFYFLGAQNQWEITHE